MTCDVMKPAPVLSVQLDTASGGRLAADQRGAAPVHGNLQKTPAGWKGPTKVAASSKTLRISVGIGDILPPTCVVVHLVMTY